MELVIKNNKNKKQRAVVFGSLDCNTILFHDSEKEVDFFDFSTDDGIDISINGDVTFENRLKLINKTKNWAIRIKDIEYYSNLSIPSMFHVLRSDVNGVRIINPIILQKFLKPSQENIFPIIIDSNEAIFHGLGLIDYLTSLLFILKPNEEIRIKLNEI